MILLATVFTLEGQILLATVFKLEGQRYAGVGAESLQDFDSCKLLSAAQVRSDTYMVQ